MHVLLLLVIYCCALGSALEQSKNKIRSHGAGDIDDPFEMDVIFHPAYSQWSFGKFFLDFDRFQKRMMNNLFDGLESRLDFPNSEKIVNDPEKFAVSLDVSNFKPEDLNVRLEGRVLTVEGNQEQKYDQNYLKRLVITKFVFVFELFASNIVIICIFKSFLRKWTLPANTDISAVKSKLTADGQLHIEAPKLVTTTLDSVAIPIEQQ